MKVARIEIKNILGIQDLQFEPGRVTEITGKNGTGKTSALEAIKAALKGGNQAELLRNGAEEGEIVLVLDSGIRIQKTITADGTDVKMTHPEHGKVSSPAKMIAGLADALSVNPVEFLTADPKERVNVLLAAMPLKISAATISVLSGGDTFLQDGADPEDHALEVLETLHKNAFARRQDINRAAKEKRSTVEQLGTGLKRPAKPVEQLRADVDSVFKAGDEKGKEIHAIELAANTAMNAEIEAIKERYRQGTPEVIKAGAELQVFRDTYRQLKDELETAVKSATAFDAVDRMSKEATDLEAKAVKMTDMLDRIQEHKSAILKDLPIPGLEIRGKQIFVDGADFEHVNKAKRVEIAVKIAQIRAKQLGLVCVDEIESLDSETFAALEAELEKSGLQLITTRVSDSAFEVVTK